ncbi:MAG: Uma2 family endonuclease [Chloroflexaceae bacterium]|jgi:Uma2 family endonuclease|nr:Uma2 family endonuclease [Chloroflexaceae bacterium]
MTVETLIVADEPETTDEPFSHFYDEYPTTEDLMGSSAIQGQLVRYLVSLLEWHYRAYGWFIAADLNIYLRKERHDNPLVPDVALFKGVIVPNVSKRTFRSWRTYEPKRPPPQVAFEICSDTTWEKDLKEKPGRYAAFGVQEYYLYDPNDPPYISDNGERLRGWHLVDGVMVPQQPNAKGHLWSPELEAWLVPDDDFLRLYGDDGQRWLTAAEAQAQQALEAAQQALEATKQAQAAAKLAKAERAAKQAEAQRAEAEAQRAEAEAQRAEAEAQRAEAEAQRAEAERVAREAEARRARNAEQQAEAERAAREAEAQRAETERVAKEAAWAKLRELGIDPEKL